MAAVWAAVCPHSFPLPATRYGDVLHPPSACHACRSDNSFGTAIRSGAVYNVPNHVFEEGPWDSGGNLFPQNAVDPSNVRGSRGPNGFGTPPDPVQAQAGTSLPQTQKLRQRPKPSSSSPFKVLFLDGNKKNSHVAKRRGPLTEGGRDNIKRLRTKGGACWRCKVLKKQCDGETPCKECSTGESRKWHLGCKRGNIKDRIKGKIPDLALGTGEWFWPSEDKTQFRIRITYDNLDPTSVIRDCKYLAGEVISSSQAESSILEFVEQFYDVDARWSETYSEPALECMKKCARLQATTIGQASSDLGMPSRALIALSLRCLMLTREIYIASLLMEGEWSEDEDENGRRTMTIDGSDIEILELKTSDKYAPHRNDHINSKSISQALEQLLQLTQGLIMRRKAKDWATVLFTLCLIDMIRVDLARCWAQENIPLHKVYFDLCSLFEVTSKNFLPLSHRWDKEAYSRLVGGNDVVVGNFQWMHDRWLELEATDDFNDAPLGDKIEAFLDLEFCEWNLQC